jgi:hypothetical protein
VDQKLTTLISKENHEDLIVLTELIEAGKVTPVIDRTYPLGETPEAIGYIGARHRVRRRPPAQITRSPAQNGPGHQPIERHLVRCLLDPYQEQSLDHLPSSSSRQPGHWAIENGLHHARDLTFANDASQIRSDAGPHVMACLRYLDISVRSGAGPINLAAAPRHHARDPARPLSTLGITHG